MCVALAWRRLLFWPFGADHTYVEHSAALSSALHPGKGSKNRILHHLSRTSVVYALMSCMSYGILCSRWSTLWGIKGWKKHTKT